MSSTTELQGLVDGVDHWLQYGPDGDGSYEALVDGAGDDEPEWSSTAKDDDPVFILYTGGTTGESKGALHTHRSVFAGMLNQTVAERIVPSDVYMLTGQMFHIPVVLAMNYMAHGRPKVLMNFERQAGDGADRGRARLGVPRRHHDDQLDDGGRELLVVRHLVAAQHPVRRRPDAVGVVIQEAIDIFPCTMIQGYGQTEGTTMSFLSQEDHIAPSTAPPRAPALVRPRGLRHHAAVVDDEGNACPPTARPRARS